MWWLRPQMEASCEEEMSEFSSSSSSVSSSSLKVFRNC